MATITSLSIEERASHGFTHKIVMTYLDLADKTSATAFSIFPKVMATTGAPVVPIGWQVWRCALRVKTLFVSASTTDLSVIIGDDGDDNRFLTSSEIGGTTSPVTAGVWYLGPPTTWNHIYTATNTIDMIATITGGTLAAATAGEWEIYLAMSDLTMLNR